jgi:hypothetical protein
MKDFRPGSADWEAVNGERFYPTIDFQPTVKPCPDSEMSSDPDATREEPEDGERSET